MEDMYGAKYGERVNSLATEGHGLAAILHALKIYQMVPDFQTMWVAGHQVILLPVRTINVMEGSCQPSSVSQHDALLERHVSHAAELPSGVILGAALVTVSETGRTPMQVANFSDQDIYCTSNLEPP